MRGKKAKALRQSAKGIDPKVWKDWYRVLKAEAKQK